MYQSTQLFQFAYFSVNCIYFLNRYLFVEYLFSASPKILKEGNCGKLKSSDLILNQQIIQKFVQDISLLTVLISLNLGELGWSLMLFLRYSTLQRFRKERLQGTLFQDSLLRSEDYLPMKVNIFSYFKLWIDESDYKYRNWCILRLSHYFFMYTIQYRV